MKWELGLPHCTRHGIASPRQHQMNGNEIIDKPESVMIGKTATALRELLDEGSHILV